MSTTMRNAGLTARGEPLSRGRSATGRSWCRVLAELLRWAAARPTLTVTLLVLGYLAALAGLVAVLAASALDTILGKAVWGLYAAVLLVYLAIAVYVVLPETGSQVKRVARCQRQSATHR
jgi:hypothetical protein